MTLLRLHQGQTSTLLCWGEDWSRWHISEKKGTQEGLPLLPSTILAGSTHLILSWALQELRAKMPQEEGWQKEAMKAEARKRERWLHPDVDLTKLQLERGTQRVGQINNGKLFHWQIKMCEIAAHVLHVKLFPPQYPNTCQEGLRCMPAGSAWEEGWYLGC